MLLSFAQKDRSPQSDYSMEGEERKAAVKNKQKFLSDD